MLPFLTEYLMLSDEAAVLVRGGRVLRLNGSAEAMLGADCVGRSVRQVFGEEIASMQAPNFLACVTIGGRPRTVRASRIEGLQLLFLAREEKDLSVVNDASLSALRNCLMNLSLCADRGRRRAEELGDAELDGCFTALTKQYFLLRRVIENTAVVYAMLRGELAATFAATDLAALCRGTVQTLALLLPGEEFRVSAPEQLPLHADAKLLETLLLNLLANCLQHAEGRSRISVGLQLTDQSAILSVSDDGCGIAPEKMHTVFARYRGGYDAASLSSGSGLGLSVVRAVAEKHGGTLLLESRVGQGTTVRVSVSRDLGGARLHGPVAERPCEMSALLTGLAPCLPDACFGAKYLD